VHRWEDNIKMDLKKLRCEVVGLIDVCRLGTCGGPFEQYKYFIKCKHNCRTGSFSRRTLLVKLTSLPFGRSVSQSEDVSSCGLVPGRL
jgi:hypothetical protein